MLLINWKIHLESDCIELCILSSTGNSENIKIRDPKLHVHIVTLSTKDNINLTKQLRDGVKWFDSRNTYQTIPSKVITAK